MLVAIIGGSGHIGSYLTPRLIEAGCRVISISRGLRAPYVRHSAWKQVSYLTLDRDIEEAAGNFGEHVASIDPEVVIDLTCYTVESVVQLTESLRGRVGHFLSCGTVWVHGPGNSSPTTEAEVRKPLGDYGCRKAAIEAHLLEQARAHQFPATVLHPGHLVGPGWNPINPAGNFNPDIFSQLAVGAEVLIPNLGLETVHHVHADDVAQSFVAALSKRKVSVGEAFHVVSPAALTLREYAERMAVWFGHRPRFRFLAFDEWRQYFSEKDSGVTAAHLVHSSNCSIEKAKALLAYAPRYSSLEAVQESVTWAIGQGLILTSEHNA
jgi:nucleoside-diphosphate-sugar epimerase